MEQPKIFRLREVAPNPLAGSGDPEAGWMRRIIYPHNIQTKGTFFGIAEVKPGYSPHRWHTHTVDKFKGFEVMYPKDFEEIYYVISGSGVVQWKTEDGKAQEEKVNAGDTIFFPDGVGEHQLFNNGTEKIVMVFCGSPPAKVTFEGKPL
jgi:oxalate decarboxylase/phosphoglucose isomerase-like protein (cupin superfamily)